MENKNRCKLCNRAITLYQHYFNMGICMICDKDIPNYIHYTQKHKYLLQKFIKKGII